jgi:hypothetical protein
MRLFVTAHLAFLFQGAYFHIRYKPTGKKRIRRRIIPGEV